MDYELKRINILSATKITFLISLILGLLFSLFYLVCLTILQNVVDYIGGGIFEENIIQFVSASSLFIVIFISLFYSVTVSVFTIFFCALYNIIAGKFGGISFNLINKAVNSITEKIEQSQES